MRRSKPRDDRHVRQPRLPQRCGDRDAAAHPFASDASRSRGGGDLRQGTSRRHDGTGRLSFPAGRAGARWRHVAATTGRGCRKSTDDRSSLRARRDHAGRGCSSRLCRMCVTGRRLPVPRDGGDVAGGCRGARADGSPCSVGAQRPADLARRGPAIGHGIDASCRLRASLR